MFHASHVTQGRSSINVPGSLGEEGIIFKSEQYLYACS